MRTLLWYIDRFDSGSSHHRAAIQCLEQSLPAEALSREAEWINIFEMKDSEFNSKQEV
jgi:hypothetical protein